MKIKSIVSAILAGCLMAASVFSLGGCGKSEEKNPYYSDSFSTIKWPDSALACFAFQLAFLQLQPSDVIQAVADMYFFHTALEMNHSVFQINVAVDKTTQLTCSEPRVEHQEVCRRLLIQRFSVGVLFEGNFTDFIQLLIREHNHQITLGLAFLILRGKVIVLLYHVDHRHRIIRDRTLLI